MNAANNYGRVVGWINPTQDLGFRRLFYLKFLKPWHFELKKNIPGSSETVSSRDGIDKMLDVDEPRLRQIVDENIERHIQHPTAAQFMDVNQLEGWLQGNGGNRK